MHRNAIANCEVAGALRISIGTKDESTERPRSKHAIQADVEYGYVERKEAHMLNATAATDEASLEQCIDEIGQFVDTLGRYQEPVLAFALRTHLSALLRAMVDCRTCTREEARQFLVELERETLGVGE